MNRPVRRILVVELLGGFGDVLLVLPAVHALARSHPGAAVTVLTFTPGDALLRSDPHIAQVVATDDHATGAPRRAVAAELARVPYDLVVTTTTYDGIGDLCAAAAPQAVTNLWRNPPADERVDRRFLWLLAADGVIAPTYAGLPLVLYLTREERDAGRADLAALLGPAAGPPVVLVPGSGMPVKEWPAERWAELAADAGRAGRPALLAAAPGAPPVPGAEPLPPGNLRDLAARLAAVGDRGGVVVGGDTGPVRLATAVGTRAVGLFGPTLAARYGPDPALSLTLQGLPGCEVRRPTAITEQECWWSARCPLTGDAPACMADLAVATVRAAADLPDPQHPVM
ncbi:MAG: glycosyltransferase family 9 protein [Actinomycetes bacterium]